MMTHYKSTWNRHTNFEIMVNNNKLTQQEVELIKNTWETVGNSIEMAIDFYNRLFYLYPVMRPMFKENIRLQARKFTSQISELVTKINGRSGFHPEANELVVSHRSLEIKPHYYDGVKEALFYTLKNHLKNDWNESVELAWIKFYKIIADRLMRSSQ